MESITRSNGRAEAGTFRAHAKGQGEKQELCVLPTWREEILILMSYGDQRILRKLENFDDSSTKTRRFGVLNQRNLPIGCLVRS